MVKHKTDQLKEWQCDNIISPIICSCSLNKRMKIDFSKFDLIRRSKGDC